MVRRLGFLSLAVVVLASCQDNILPTDPDGPVLHYNRSHADFTVNTNDDVDDGVCDLSHCSLREAINAANAKPGKDLIAFRIPGYGVHTIQPLSQLPTITDPVTIDGYTQRGARPNRRRGHRGSNARLKIELDGSRAGNVHGLSITGADSKVQGLVINRFGLNGVLISEGDAKGNLIRGNFIGVDVTGTSPLGNGLHGVRVRRAPGNTIGGIEPGARNVISGNAEAGVLIMGLLADGNFVQGNYIGTDATGTVAVGNGIGVWIMGWQNTIGGTIAGARNIISGNLEGVTLEDLAEDNLVQGNYIGTDVNGTSAISNGIGVALMGSGNSIGGTSNEAGNTIAYNDGPGVGVRERTGNAVLSNSIFSNAGLGIDLIPDGPTANDPGDGDTGANNLQNFPVLTSAKGRSFSMTIEGQLNSTANTDFRLEFFANETCDPSGNGEGQRFIGVENVTTDGNGDASVDARFWTARQSRSWRRKSSFDFITATATDPDGNTSEFSRCVEVEYHR